MSMTESPSKIDHTFLVAEYQALRDEIIKRLEIQQQLHSFALVAFGTFLTIGFQSKTVTIPLLYPIFALFLAVVWSLHDLRINELGSYIRSRIEAKLLDDGQGWESALAPRNAQNPVGIFSQISSRGLFLGTQIISMLPFIMAIFTKAIDLRSAPFDQVIVGLDIAVIIATFYLAKRGGPTYVFD